MSFQHHTLLLWVIALTLLFSSFYKWLACLLLISLYLLSTTSIARILAHKLEQQYPHLSHTACPKTDAIVVLGAGAPTQSPEWPFYQPTALTLERIRYAAALHKRCQTPILSSGGGFQSEAESMARVLQEDYGIVTTWQEKKSTSTWENAQFSYTILGKKQNRIILVTHAFHMPRAVYSFEQAGFDVTPAPTAYLGGIFKWKRLTYWKPRTSSLRLSGKALHEYGGLIWYHFYHARKTSSEQKP